MTDKKIRFIISRNSGKQSIYIHMMDKIRKAYKHLPKLNVVVTKRENHIVELAKEWADRYGEDGIVYVLGGVVPVRLLMPCTKLILTWV